ncbi:amino acid ABC transporter substrate-binding protein [Oleiphilus messinensis]|uniref:Amino acid ABC transporter substrate-binding protein n=1 Tax=Oleiphilus messinensis TaxID=141451 RepID=A0A1Y0I5E3_9GAMM|nr:transporter substrate-binding domain-containing protein [Oleiphilus messinensis]ARU55631.1 amino acid ABC transporter substrate-binding protein [Oleiphilus messinensis]
MMIPRIPIQTTGVMPFILWLPLSLLVCVTALPANAVDSPRIRLTNGEWPPYLSESLPHYGLASHLVAAAFRAEGVQVEYGFFSWERAYNQAKAGRWDGSVIWGRKGDREDHFYFSDPVLLEETVFFYRHQGPNTKSGFNWQSFQDLKGYIIGTTRSYHYGKQFETARQSGVIEIQETGSDENNFRKLQKGRIDLFPLDRVVGQALLQSLFIEHERGQIRFHPKAIISGSLHLILSRAVDMNGRRIKQFNAGLQTIKDNGHYQEIMNLHLKSGLNISDTDVEHVP